jgi:signal transduction histidine kinase
VIDALAVQSVPLRALTLSLVAMTVAVSAAVFWPEALLDQQILAGGLALMPALLLAHYRGWPGVAAVLGVGLVGLCLVQLSPVYFGRAYDGSFVIPFVLAPYIAIALGAGWFGEVRRYQAELQTTQLQLIQSEKLDSVGRMAAGVAHEVKNPLMMILTGVKILSKRLGDSDEPTRQLLQDMTDAVERADKIIGGLLSYSRDRGLDIAPADLNATIDKALLLVKHELDKGQIVVIRHLDPGLPPLQLDEFKMQQVFVNMFTNALHAMEHHGEIHVRTSVETLSRGRNVGHRKTDRFRPGQRVALVRIDDTGPGIPKEHLAKIFDPFFTTKPTGKGTGLGLSVSRQIVEMHGGTIEIGNREEGGAQVRMIFAMDQ